MDQEDVEYSRQDAIDPMLRAHINSLCSALGGSSSSESGQYALGDDALACLKDLKRWLKGFDEKLNRFDVARCMAESNLVIGDLLEILATIPEDQSEDRAKGKIALACVELLVPLTWPLEKRPETMTVNHHKHTPVLEYAQASYKKNMLHHPSKKILRSCIRVCLPSVALSPDERSERDEGIIKLVLYLLRNIALIQHPNPTETDTGEEIDREATIEAFHDHDVFHFLLAVSSGMGEEFNTQDMVVMEIIYHLVKGINIEKLFLNDEETRTKNTSNLEHLLSMEKGLKMNNAKATATRHSRFGTTLWVQRQDGRRVTVSGQDVLADKAGTLAKIDGTKKWKKPRFKPRSKEPANDFDMTVTLKVSGKKKLREFVEFYLDSGFNPLFNHVRRAIERESDRVLQVHSRQFFYLVAWFLEAERMRRKTKLSNGAEIVPDDLSFGLVAAVLNQESLIILKKYMMEWFDMKQWTDLEAGMRCFIQILHTVHDMTGSPLEEDQEIAENIQNRLFYEETTLDLIVSILRRYDRQPFGYLDACTELVHVHLKMLERYAKQNTHIFVRTKRQQKSRRKKINPDSNDPGDGNTNESDEELEAEHNRVSRERAFNFIQYEAKFLSQTCVNTFLALLGYYKELNYTQFKRVIAFFHRLFVKREVEVPLYRMDILELFCRIMQGKEGLQRNHPAYKEMDQFVRHYIKQMVRKLQSTPALYIEILFSKTSRSSYVIQYGKDHEPTPKKPKSTPELEIRAGLGYPEKIGVAVSVLLNEQKDGLVDWLKGVLSKAVSNRKAWEDEHAARRMLEEVSLEETEAVKESEGTAPSITVAPESNEQKNAMSKDPKMILLLKVLGFEGLDVEGKGEMAWIIPASITSAQLQERLGLLKNSTDDPPIYEDGKTAEDFVKRKTKPRAPRMEGSDDDGDEAAEFQFEPNLLKPPKPAKDKNAVKKRRRRDDVEEALDDVELAEKELELELRREERRKKNEEKQKQIKSALYINDSDDESDEERDKLFFERENALRKQVEQVVSVDTAMETTSPSRPQKRRRKTKVINEDNLDTGKARSVTASSEDEGMADVDPDKEQDGEEHYIDHRPITSEPSSIPSPEARKDGGADPEKEEHDREQEGPVQRSRRRPILWQSDSE